MAIPKAKTQHHVITATLTNEEHDLLEAFAAEQGIPDLEQAVPAMVHEMVRLYDLLWDKQLEQIPAALDAMAQKALDDHRAGSHLELVT